MGSFERFTTKTHFNSLKRQVLLAALLMLAVKLLVTALGAPPDGSWLDLLARVPPNVADVGAAVLVFEVLRTRRAANRAARSAVLVAASPVLFVASGVHGDPAGVAVALLLLGTYLLVDHDAPLAAGIVVGVAARVDPLVLLAAPVALALAARPGRQPPGDARARPTGGGGTRTRLLHFAGALGAALLAGWVPALAWGWRAREAVPHPGGPGALGPGWLLARPPRRRQVGQHLQRRRRRHPAVDRRLVGAGAALGRRGRAGRAAGRRPRRGAGARHLAGAGHLGGDRLADGGAGVPPPRPPPAGSPARPGARPGPGGRPRPPGAGPDPGTSPSRRFVTLPK